MKSASAADAPGNGIGGSARWVAAIGTLAVVLFHPGVLNDGDTFWHLTTGDWILAHGAVPHADVFSYTFAGRPWLPHEWLADVFMAVAFRAARWDGLLLLVALAAAAAVFQLCTHLSRWFPPRAVLVLGIFAIGLTGPVLLARPHILVLPVLEGWVAGLVIARSTRRAPSWYLLPLMVLWTNMHASFMVGLALILPLALEAILEDRDRWRETARAWGLFFVAACLASSATPHGFTGVLFPLQFVQTHGLTMISEWRAPDFNEPQPLEIALLAALFFVMSRGVQLPTMRLILVLGLLHMALGHIRHQVLLGFIAPLLIAQPLGTDRRLETGAIGGGKRWATAGLMLGLCVIGLRMALPVVRVDGPTAPVSAIRHVPAALSALPVFNEYGFGGYLIFSRIRPFIDGRLDMYGDAFFDRYLRTIRPDISALTTTLNQYRVQWTILGTDNPAVAALDALPGWCRFYTDKVTVIHVAASSIYCRTSTQTVPRTK